MDETARKAEILQAEQAILLLAGEMANAKSAATAAEEVRAKLEGALASLAGIRDGVAEAAREQADVAEASRQAVAATLSGAKAALAGAGKEMQSGLAEVREACANTKAASEEMFRRTDQLVKLLEGRLSDVSASIEALSKDTADMSVSLGELEKKVTETSSLAQSLAVSVAEGRQEARNAPAELMGRLRRALRSQKAYLLSAIILSVATFLGLCVVLWRMAYSGAT